MLMWLIIFGLVIIAALAAVLCLLSKFRKLGVVRLISRGNGKLSWAVSAAMLAGMSVALVLVFDVMNAIICVLHLVAAWLICDLILLIIKKIRGKDMRRYYGGAAAFVITAAYLSVGWYLAHDVSVKSYCVENNKNNGELRIVQLADAHIGATFDAEEFSRYIERINNENPDVVVITGDLVDDGTSRKNMIDGCRALSAVKAKYGVYFSYGNHDRGYSQSDKRGWTADDLAAELRKNGVVILEDETADIGDDFCIIGRRDSSETERLPIDKLADRTDSSRFSIVLDHQPGDYQAEADAGVGLVLSGHTHGGQLIPITYVGEWIGVNCRTYGYEKRDDTNFIVTSGIGAWSIKFKTGCRSEYVVIDIE